MSIPKEANAGSSGIRNRDQQNSPFSDDESYNSKSNPILRSKSNPKVRDRVKQQQNLKESKITNIPVETKRKKSGPSDRWTSRNSSSGSVLGKQKSTKEVSCNKNNSGTAVWLKAFGLKPGFKNLPSTNFSISHPQIILRTDTTEMNPLSYVSHVQLSKTSVLENAKQTNKLPLNSYNNLSSDRQEISTKNLEEAAENYLESFESTMSFLAQSTNQEIKANQESSEINFLEKCDSSSRENKVEDIIIPADHQVGIFDNAYEVLESDCIENVISDVGCKLQDKDIVLGSDCNNPTQMNEFSDTEHLIRQDRHKTFSKIVAYKLSDMPFEKSVICENEIMKILSKPAEEITFKAKKSEIKQMMANEESESSIQDTVDEIKRQPVKKMVSNYSGSIYPKIPSEWDQQNGNASDSDSSSFRESSVERTPPPEICNYHSYQSKQFRHRQKFTTRQQDIPKEITCSTIQSKTYSFEENFFTATTKPIPAIKQSPFSSKLVRTVCLVLVVVSAGILSYIFQLHKFSGEKDKLDISSIMDNLKMQFPQQSPTTFRIVENAIKDLVDPQPNAPAIITLLASPGAGVVTQQFALQLANSIASSKHMVVIKGKEYKNEDPDNAKYAIDKSISGNLVANELGAVFVDGLDYVPSEAALILHGYCDHEHAPYRRALFLFTVLTEELLPMDSPKDWDRILQQYLYRAWSATGEDQVSALLTRLTVHVAVLSQ